jgi:hypothetical protein
MKKILFAVLVIAGIAACNSPQQMTTSGSDSSTMVTPTDSSTTMPMTTDTTMQGDTAKRDTLR